MSRWMNTRRSAKLQNIVVETDADKDRERERFEASQKNAAAVPDFANVPDIDRYADEDYEEPENKWSANCPSEEEISAYLKEMKKLEIPINTAYDILSDHDMDIRAALRMVIDKDLVPVELMDASDKLMLQAVAPLLGTYTDSKRKELYNAQYLFPGLQMTTVYEEAFKQKLELLCSYTGDIEKAKTVVKRQMAQMSATKTSPVAKNKKGTKRQSTTPEGQPGKVPRMSESPINTSTDSAGYDSNSPDSYPRESISPAMVAPRNVPVTAKPVVTTVPAQKNQPRIALQPVATNSQQLDLQALLVMQYQILNQLHANQNATSGSTVSLASGTGPVQLGVQNTVLPKVPVIRSDHSAVNDANTQLQVKLKLLGQLMGNQSVTPNLAVNSDTGKSSVSPGLTLKIQPGLAVTTSPGISASKPENSVTSGTNVQAVCSTSTAHTIQPIATDVPKSTAPERISSAKPLPEVPVYTVPTSAPDQTSFLVSSMIISKKNKPMEEKPGIIDSVQEAITKPEAMDTTDVSKQTVVVEASKTERAIKSKKPKDTSKSLDKSDVNVTEEEAIKRLKREVAIALKEMDPRKVAAIFIGVTKSEKAGKMKPAKKTIESPTTE